MNPDEFNFSERSSQAWNKQLPVVAIGAAAGGVEAVKELLQNLTYTGGFCYVYIQYPDALYDGQLKALLSHSTAMPVIDAEEGVTIMPDHLYVLPHGKSLVIKEGTFVAEKRSFSLLTDMPISHFFTALAEEQQEQTIGILLSGSVSDGIQGLKNIKMAGGVTFAQNDTALFQTMPKLAIAEGAADRMLSPKELAEELITISRKKDVFFKAINQLDEELISNTDEDLKSLLLLMNRSTGVDFTQYKMNTIKRRIIRRMMLHKHETLKDYLEQLKRNVTEVNFLYQDLLINVTSFFRDEETTDYLRDSLLPKLISGKGPNNPVRVWVPACSTGQEAYSWAMLIIEALGENAGNIQVQIFATDLSETAVAKARLGVYSKDEMQNVSPRRMQRFFTKPDGHYRILKSIRDICVFATHNIAKDPPFSRLDIISCCNLMIYLDTPLQKKVMATFHHSLNNNGCLILGKSETVGASAYLFSQLDKKLKIYGKKKEAAPKAAFEMNYRVPELGRLSASSSLPPLKKIKNDEMDLDTAVDAVLLKKFTPASVVVNYDLDILLFRGSTGLFLEPSPGKASLNLMKMAKQGLGFELRNIVHKSKKSGEAVKKEGLELTADGKQQRVTIEALPLKNEGEEDYFLIVFKEADELKDDKEYGSVKDRRVKQLEAELTALREDMRAIVESQEAANEELQSANEEIVSSNEELQSINEELETSKEEIESSNEELITINQELQIRNEQLAEAQEYSESVFTFMRESLVILDRDLRVKVANKAFYKTFGEREEDTEGRLFFDLGDQQWNLPQLRVLLDEALANNTDFYNFEVTHYFKGIGEKVILVNGRKVIQKSHGQHLLLLAIEDITEYRQSQKIIAGREAWFRNMADNAPVMIWVTGSEKLCTFVNKTFLEFRGITLNEAIGKTWLEDAHPDDIDRCQAIYETCFEEKTAFELTYRLKHHKGRYQKILTKAKPNFTTEGTFTGFIGSCVEVDEEMKKAAKEEK